HARADVLRRPRLLGHRPAALGGTRLPDAARRRRHLDRARHRSCNRRRADADALVRPRTAWPDPEAGGHRRRLDRRSDAITVIHLIIIASDFFEKWSQLFGPMR